MTATQVRALTEAGVDWFGDYLQSLRDGGTDEPPFHLLTNTTHTRELSGSALVEDQSFKTRLAAAEYLREALDPLPREDVYQNVGLWTWLSLFYFDQVCPVRQGGKRVPGRGYRHILETDFRYQHRHLLAGPYEIYCRHGENSDFMLRGSLRIESGMYHELASRQNLIANPGVVEAARLLYYDRRRRKPKKGAHTARYQPGTLRRFIEVLRQLDVTYDIYGMDGPDIIELLPPEFDEWKPKRGLFAKLLKGKGLRKRRRRK